MFHESWDNNSLFFFLYLKIKEKEKKLVILYCGIAMNSVQAHI